MSSSVFFKFKSQKEPSRVTFDGTGISVFELKRQIIQINRLGDGSDFDLAIYNQDSNEEYEDDTTIIPRSTSIIARRLPPIKPGKGTAQRYVHGKMPTNALPNAGRREKNFGITTAPKKDETPVVTAPTANGDSEEDMISAMLEANTEQWNRTQEQMATATYVRRGGPVGQRNGAAAPSHPPPAGYVCYRCGEKGHWIQACPTNNDPTFDGRPRVKRTTGIPRSFLKTVEKPSAIPGDDNSNNPSSIMVNAEGEYVVAMPDQNSWETYQKKAANTAKSSEARGSKELQDLGIECPLCKKLMKDAVHTPCCKNAYCEECIQNALLESDFVCPNCEAKEVLLDALVPDQEIKDKIAKYQKDKEAPTKPIPEAQPAQASASKSPAVAAAPLNIPTAPRSDSTTPNPTAAQISTPTSTSSTVLKKRPADTEIGPEVPRGPAALRNAPQAPIPTAVGPVVSTYPPSGPSGMNGGVGVNVNGNMGIPIPTGPSKFAQSGYNTGFNNFNFSMNSQQRQYQNQYGGGQYYGNGSYNNGGYGNGMMGSQQGYNAGYGNGYNNYNGGYNNYSQHQQYGGMNGQMGMNAMMSGSGMGIGGGGMGQAMGMNGMMGNNMGMGMGINAMGNGMMGNGAVNGMGTGMGNGMMNNGLMGNGMGMADGSMYAADQFGGAEEDSPYMRKPVNPHRHARPKRIRPSDFKAVGGDV